MSFNDKLSSLSFECLNFRPAVCLRLFVVNLKLISLYNKFNNSRKHLCYSANRYFSKYRQLYYIDIYQKQPILQYRRNTGINLARKYIGLISINNI